MNPEIHLSLEEFRGVRLQKECTPKKRGIRLPFTAPAPGQARYFI